MVEKSNLKVLETRRGHIMLAVAACIVAVLSYLWCDPDAPYSLLVFEKKTLVRDDPDNVRRAIETYDYKIADPWGLGYTLEDLETYRKQRAAFARRLEELESQ